MKRFYLLLLCIVFAGVGMAAPATKTKEEPLGPITEEKLRKAENNLKQIALAWHNYHDTFGNFPNNEQSKDGKALLSWRVQILPSYADPELDKVWKQFKLDEPWDSVNNKKLIDKMPAIYAPVRGKADPGLTFYQAFAGKNGLIRPGAKFGLADITDGTSNTLMCVEAAKPVIWTKPDDLVFDGKDVPAVGGLFDGKWHGAMCDGSVRRFKKGVDAELMRKLIDPADGQVVNVDDAVDSNDKK